MIQDSGRSKFVNNVLWIRMVEELQDPQDALGGSSDESSDTEASGDYCVLSTDCEQKLCEPRKDLLSRYIHATKAALSRARFMKTTSLAVLQALVIYLIAVRDIDEPRAIWSLTGVAVRIAQGMGLERDGEYLGLPPFETEMRRVWWQLKIHDFRTAELCGIGKFQGLHTGGECTKWPTNINDDQLYPGMTSLAAEPHNLTDNVFISLKYELLNYAAGQVAVLNQKGNTPVPYTFIRQEATLPTWMNPL
ncbi:fungal specific transcription factor domain-containing [Trichoderma arundinaceum]|uniref:Fungal specific transcription factor domain-containing n=1 Tax=Trichoderma arundinaceum TaxID=490622 RepID=A0A395NWG6_TRIAR|nr:fungal specific transcription factor domain-containing [Trichoderma arundinaceum]